MNVMTHRKHRIVKVNSMRTVPFKVDSRGQVCAFCGCRGIGGVAYGMVTCDHDRSHLICPECLKKTRIVYDNWKGFAKVERDEVCPCHREFADRLSE